MWRCGGGRVHLGCGCGDLVAGGQQVGIQAEGHAAIIVRGFTVLA